jgi:hypothetical protein
VLDNGCLNMLQKLRQVFMIFLSFFTVFGGHLTLCNISFVEGGH